MTDEPKPRSLGPWELAGLPGRVPAASFLTGDLAAQYRLIVDILADRQADSLTGVGHDELVGLLRQRLHGRGLDAALDDVNVDARMPQLVAWGTCEAWQDRAETEADFLRNRSRYQLTEAGFALNEVARRLDAELGSGSTVALLAPSNLADHLDSTLAAIAAGDAVSASAHLADVQALLESMAQSASGWQSRLAAALGGSPDEAKINRLLETILSYVEAWGSGVDAYSARIAATLPVLLGVPTDVWRSMALARVQSTADERTIDEATRELERVVDILSHWFVGSADRSTGQAQRLRRQIRDAVAPLVRGHRTLLAVGGTVSRRAELLRLARSVEAAPDDEAAWRVWATATGLYGARHLPGHAPPVPGEARVSVWDAPPVPISRRLRTQGQRSLSGRPATMADTSAARAEARRVAARERAEVARAEASLAGRSGTVLSAWAPLSRGEADLFLALVSSARDSRDADGVQTGLTADGRWRLRLEPIVPARSAVLSTPDGRLVLQDARAVITP